MEKILVELMRPIWVCVGVLVAIILSLIGFVVSVPALLVYRFGCWLLDCGKRIVEELS